MSTLKAALRYAALGWHVFPCRDKQPLTQRGLHDAVVDEAQIRAWWKRWPDAQVAIATGAVSDLYVVDEDADGAATIAGLDLPPTLTATTGNGRHFYFRRPTTDVHGERFGNTAKRLGPGVDTRGDGGYVVAPPSIHHVTGKPYEWAEGEDPVDLPARVVDMLRKPTASTTAASPFKRTDRGGYGEAAIRDEIARVRNAAEGTRNDALNRAAFSLGQLVAGGELDGARVRAELVAAGLAVGLEEREVDATIRSGLEGGKAQPRTRPERPERTSTTTKTKADEPGDEWAREVRRARDDLRRAGYDDKRTAEQTERAFGPASALFSEAFPDTPWLVEGLMTERGVFVVGGEPKTAKTWAALEIAVAVATGTKAFGEFAARRTAPALCFLTEDMRRATRNRLRAIASFRGMAPEAATERVWVECMRTLDLGKLDHLAVIVASTRLACPDGAGVVILDPLRNLHGAEENSATEMAPVMDGLRVLRSVLGCAVVFVHHMGKEPTGQKSGRAATARLRGSNAVHGAVDGALLLTGLDGDGQRTFSMKAQGQVKAARSAGYFDLDLEVDDDDGGEAVSLRWAVARTKPKEKGADDGMLAGQVVRAAVETALAALDESAFAGFHSAGNVAVIARKKKADVLVALHELAKQRKAEMGARGGWRKVNRPTLVPMVPAVPGTDRTAAVPGSPPFRAGTADGNHGTNDE